MTEVLLRNGLKAVLVPTAAAPVATVLIVYHVGSRNEAVGHTGSSHLLEHLLFKGTPENQRSNGRAFADMMSEIGAVTNATTGRDCTMYFETVPAGYLEFALRLEADRMRNALIADAARRSEMAVVRNELASHESRPTRVLDAALVATVFREHPYHHPTIGWRSDVERMSTERLRRHYDTYYQPGNATLFVVGDFDSDRIREAVESSFGALPRAAREIPEVYATEPPQAGERSVVVEAPGAATVVAYAFRTPAALGQHGVLSRAQLAERAATLPAEHDVDALDVLARILGSGRRRLLARVLTDAGLALDASAWQWRSRDPGLFQIVASVRPGVGVDAVRRAIDELLATLREDGPDAAQIERVRAQVAVQRAFAFDGTYSLAQRLAEFEASGTWRLDESSVERIARVTPERVRDVARIYLREDNRTVGVLLTGTAKTSYAVPLAAGEPLAEEPAAVEAAPPPPGARRSGRFAERIARGVLANGGAWRYVAAPQTLSVHVRGVIDAGPAFTPGRPMLARVVAEMLSRGTRRQRRDVLQERLEGAGVWRGYDVDDIGAAAYDPLAFRFSGKCPVAALPLMLRTLAEELREPAFEPAELEAVRAQIIGSLRLAAASPGWRAAQRFHELAYEAGDVHAWPDAEALIAEVAALEVEDVRAHHARFVLGSPPIVSGSGAVDPDTWARLLADTLGSVPFVPCGGAALPGTRARPAREERADVALGGKGSVHVVIGRATALRRCDPDYLAATIANALVGRSSLSSRLGLQLRERDGVTYGVSSAFLSAGTIPGPWRVAFMADPAHAGRAIASARDVLRAFAADGPRARELDAQRNAMAGRYDLALATNAGLAVQLELLGYFALGDDYADTYRERLAGVALADVTAAARRYLGERDLIAVTAG